MESHHKYNCPKEAMGAESWPDSSDASAMEAVTGLTTQSHQTPELAQDTSTGSPGPAQESHSSGMEPRSIQGQEGSDLESLDDTALAEGVNVDSDQESAVLNVDNESISSAVNALSLDERFKRLSGAGRKRYRGLMERGFDHEEAINLARVPQEQWPEEVKSGKRPRTAGTPEASAPKRANL